MSSMTWGGGEQSATALALHHWREVLGLLGIVLMAILLRLHGIEAEAPWADEINILVPLQEEPTFRAYMERLREWEATTAFLYPAAAWVWGRWVASPGVLSMRMLSLVFGLASIVVTYLIARRTSGIVAAMTSAAFLAVTQPHIYYSIEIRPYALLMFTVAVSSYAFLALLNAARQSVPWWIVHLAANFAVVWTHLLGWVLLVAQGLTLLLFRGRQVRLWLGWGVLQLPAVILLGVLWIRTINWEVLERVIPALEAPTLAQVGWGFRMFAGLFHVHALPDSLAAVWAPVLFGGAAATCYLAWRRHGRGAPARAAGEAPAPRGLGYALIWLVAPMATLWVISFVWTWMLASHYMIYCALAGAVLVGCGLAALPKPGIRAGVVCLVLGLGAYAHLAYPGPMRTNYFAVFERIASEPVLSVPVYVAPLVYHRCSEYNWWLLEWPGFKPEFIPVETKEDVVPAIAEHGFREGLAWILLHHVEMKAAVEVSAQLNEAGLTHETYTPPGGAPRVTVYRIEEPTD
ncbi:MAG: hypothetical protein ACLFU6_04580 [Candidatus Hydrogenedentota bacterium]